jgi:hypothetical protein
MNEASRRQARRLASSPDRSSGSPSLLGEGTGGVSGVTSPVIFDRQAWRDEVVTALVEGDEIDFHFALKLSDEEEREAALSVIHDRLDELRRCPSG